MKMLADIVHNEEQWDAFVLAHGGGFLQSWGWSEFQQALGRPVFRFRLDSDGGEGQKTVAQFLLVMQTMRFGFRNAYVPRGPIVDWSADGAGRFGGTLEAVRETMKREGAIFGRIDLPMLAEGGPIAAADLTGLGLRQAHAVQPKQTLIVDLTKSEETILAEMHPKTRYNIKVAAKHGVTVREAEYGNAHLFSHDVDLFWKLMEETTERDGFRAHPKAYYAKMLEVCSAKKHQGLFRARLIFAEYRGEPAATAIMGAYGDTVTYLHGASVARLRNVMAPFLLHWTMMTEAKRQGYRNYDFWGIAPTDDPKHPWAGITRFKTGFGGRKTAYLGAWDLPGRGFWYNLYRAVRK